MVVTDQQGNFVRDLKKEDFQVLEDGKRQTISTFSLVDIPVERADRPLFAAAPIEPDVQTNERPFDGRIYVMVIDDLHTALRTQHAREGGGAAVHRAEPRRQRSDGRGVHRRPADASQEFTSNKRLLLAAVDKFSGRKLDSATREQDQRVQPTPRACGSRATR